MDRKDEALNAYLKGFKSALDSFAKHQNLFLFYMQLEMAKNQANMILQTPKAPKFAEGGIVPANTRTGDIVTIPKNGYGESSLSSLLPDLKAYNNINIIIGVDPGRPEGDWS